MRLIFAEILRDLKESGYHVSARLMNAMYYGVPPLLMMAIAVKIRRILTDSTMAAEMADGERSG